MKLHRTKFSNENVFFSKPMQCGIRPKRYIVHAIAAVTNWKTYEMKSANWFADNLDSTIKRTFDSLDHSIF